MKLLGAIRRVLALAVAIWAMVLAVFYLFFARVSFESSAASQVNGGPLVMTTSSGEYSWLSQAPPLAVAFMLAFSILLVAAAVGMWRGVLAIALPLSLLALVFSFLSGFSIGGLYFPGAAAAFLGGLLAAIEKLASRSDRPVI